MYKRPAVSDGLKKPGSDWSNKIYKSYKIYKIYRAYS